MRSVNLTAWARAQGVHPQTARKWLRVGTLPVAARRVGPGTILVNVDAGTAMSAGVGVGRYARVSWHGQESDLDRRAAGLAGWAAVAGHRVVRVESEVGSGVNGARVKVRRLLSDRKVHGGGGRAR